MFVPSLDPLAVFFFGYFDWWECECGLEVYGKNATPQGAELAEINDSAYIACRKLLLY